MFSSLFWFIISVGGYGGRIVTREPVVAGTFYPGEKKNISDMIESWNLSLPDKKSTAFGVVVPHAGYLYSGSVSAEVFGRVELGERVVLIGPNHRGAGKNGSPPKIAMAKEGQWAVPGATFRIDHDFIGAITEKCDLAQIDIHAHLNEHSLEVQLPLIASFNESLPDIVPISASHLTASDCLEVAEVIAELIGQDDRKTTMIASTDFSHYVPQEKAEKADRIAIQKIIDLDGQGLLDAVHKEGISMCGAEPTTIVITVCKLLGASKGELVRYKTSGETSGDFSSVVGYGGLIIS